MDPKPGQSLKPLLGDLMPSIHGLAQNPSDSAYRHVTNAIVRQTTGCCPVSHLIQKRRLRFFGHVARADFQQDHHRVIEASLRPPSRWRRPCGRPRSTWLRESIRMCSQLTLGSTQPIEKPLTVHSVMMHRRHGNTPSRGTPLKRE